MDDGHRVAIQQVLQTARVANAFGVDRKGVSAHLFNPHPIFAVRTSPVRHLHVCPLFVFGRLDQGNSQTPVREAGATSNGLWNLIEEQGVVLESSSPCIAE